MYKALKSKKKNQKFGKMKFTFTNKLTSFFFPFLFFFFTKKLNLDFFFLPNLSKKSIMIDDESSFQLKCILCDSDSYDNLVELNCDHLICTNCLKLHVHSTISDTKVIEVFCPKKCASAIPQYALKVPPCLSFQNSSSFTNSFMWILEYREF